MANRRCDIAELIRDTASAFKVAVNVPADLPHIDADPIRIREVLLNLLANATQHGGTIHVESGEGTTVTVGLPPA